MPGGDISDSQKRENLTGLWQVRAIPTKGQLSSPRFIVISLGSTGCCMLLMLPWICSLLRTSLTLQALARFQMRSLCLREKANLDVILKAQVISES